VAHLLRSMPPWHALSAGRLRLVAECAEWPRLSHLQISLRESEFWMEVVSNELHPDDDDDGETPLVALPEHAGDFACAAGEREEAPLRRPWPSGNSFSFLFVFLKPQVSFSRRLVGWRPKTPCSCACGRSRDEPSHSRLVRAAP